MKAILLPLLALLTLAGCHAARDQSTAPADQSTAPSSSAAVDKNAESKARDEMIGKSMNVQDQHWTSAETLPAAASSSASATSGMSAKPATAPAATPSTDTMH